MATSEILDSKWDARRSDLRTWRDLRYVLSEWSREEEDELLSDCLAVTDDKFFMDLPPTNSNTTLWAAAFERYCVPLTDLFTYGLKPHPSATRGARAKLLAPTFCHLLTEVLIHPVFQADIDLVRYILQRIVVMRMGMHLPPIGPAPIKDSSSHTLKETALILRMGDHSEKGKIQADHDAVWLYMQEHGAHKSVDIAGLEEALVEEFKYGNPPKDMPRDSTPNCRSLFYLQLWDLQFLVQVMNDLSHPAGYLAPGVYYKQWLALTKRVRTFMSTKIDGLVQAWFLKDERDYRIRQKLKQTGSASEVYDIAEEEFRPLYIESRYITEGMRAVVNGDYLTAICPPKHEGVGTIEPQGTVGDQDTKGEAEYLSSSDEGELPIRGVVDHDDDTEDDTHDDIKDESGPGGEQQHNQSRMRRSGSAESIASFFSISSSTRDEWERNPELHSPNDINRTPRRGLPNCDRHKPMFIRRRDLGQD